MRIRSTWFICFTHMINSFVKDTFLTYKLISSIRYIADNDVLVTYFHLEIFESSGG